MTLPAPFADPVTLAVVRFWPYFAAAFELAACLLASGHALLHKRDSRAATLWIAFIWLLPLAGPAFYLVLGVNRVRRRAMSLGRPGHLNPPRPHDLGDPNPGGAGYLRHLAQVVGRVVKRPLVAGNGVEPLVNGDEAFPAMLEAIEGSKISVSLCSYIFDNDPTGRRFVEALGRAVRRGVAVRVLVDAAGARYTWPPITRALRRAGIPHARFLPASVFTPWRVATINLRNHRKNAVVDGRLAFTGGMNIRHGNVLADAPKKPVQDLHFKVVGPVVADLQRTFADDWAFATGELLEGDAWFPAMDVEGSLVARVITDGPDGDFENLRLTLLAALSEAQSSVKIVTPYFLPDNGLVSVLNLAALRGVRVDIILPGRSNLPVVDWASHALWWQVLERGCHLWLTPEPFDHSKLVIVDGHWVLFGSANWDARSLRLNFELNVEAYGPEFAKKMDAIVAQKMLSAREATQAEMDGRPLLVRVRDALARQFSPYL